MVKYILLSLLLSGCAFSKKEIAWHWYEIKDHRVVCNLSLKTGKLRTVKASICQSVFDPAPSWEFGEYK